MNSFQCSFFGVKSLNKLQQFLQIKEKSQFKTLYSNLKSNPLQYYSSFKNQDNRELFKCSRQITSLHKRTMKLFNIEPSSYLKSGVKKESHITNAKCHENSNFFLLIDIKSFYPSTTKSKIKIELRRTYKQSKDVAEFISNLVTVPQEKALGKRALVTGSPLSQWFAYVINKKMFDELNKVSQEEDIKFSVYVDDITFSSKRVITYKFYTKVYSIISKYRYQIHQGKMYRGKLGDKTKVTGIQFTKYGFRLLDKHKEKIRQNSIIKLSKLNWSTIPKKLTLRDYQYQYDNLDQLLHRGWDKELKSLLGLVNFAIQVNSKYSKYLYIIQKALDVRVNHYGKSLKNKALIS
jgi:RNA-directed DNA polymerase